MEIAWYLATTYNHDMRIDGLIFITPITNVRFTGSAQKNLRMFSRLVGVESLSKVVLATSMWDQMQTSQQAEAREAELIESFWKAFIEEGSTVYRLDGLKDSAIGVVNALLPSGGNQGETLQIQRELVVESRPLNKTEAGKELAEGFRRLQESIQKRFEAMDSEVKDTTAEKDDGFARHAGSEKDRLKLRLSRIENERKGLQVDFRQLKEDRDEKLASLTRQIESERKRQAFLFEELKYAISYTENKTGNQSKHPLVKFNRATEKGVCTDGL